MPLRTILLIVVAGAIALFAAANWGAFTAPTTLHFGFATVDAPLGLIMLVLTALLAFVFLVFIIYLQTSVLLEGRRHARELQAQRELAEQAEASRYNQLRQFLEAAIDKHAEQTDRMRAEVLEKLHQLDRELRSAIEQSGNTLSAYIGEVEDLVQRRLGGQEPVKPS
jgi:Na+-transporting methylmalonyl-CoA/oxaloacetate decarboxylase gamma subunit